MDTERFIALYPQTPMPALVKEFGLQPSTLRHWACKLGVKKDPATVRQVLSEKAQGRVITDETKRKILAAKRRNGTLHAGAQHYKWKGGKAWERFKDPRYQQWRAAVLERDKYICQDCGRQCKKYERGLAAHHIKAYADYPDLRYEVSNGLTLCRNCHLSLHGRAPKPAAPIACACGCGTMMPPTDAYGRPRRYVNGHGCRGKKMPDAGKAKLSQQRKGRPLTPAHRERIAQGLRQSSHRIGRPKGS